MLKFISSLISSHRIMNRTQQRLNFTSTFHEKRYQLNMILIQFITGFKSYDCSSMYTFFYNKGKPLINMIQLYVSASEFNPVTHHWAI
jgi:hypothetical protein